MSLLLQLLLLKLALGNDGGGAGAAAAAAAAAGSARYSFYLATFLFGTYLAGSCCLVVLGHVLVYRLRTRAQHTCTCLQSQWKISLVLRKHFQ